MSQIDMFENYLYWIGILETIQQCEHKGLLLNRIINIRQEYLKPYNFMHIIPVSLLNGLFNAEAIIVEEQ